MKVLALDPGGTTGYCDYEDGVFTSGQIGPHKHHKTLWELLCTAMPDVLVCESFTYQRRDKVVLVSVEYIGVATLYSQLYNVPLYMYTPAMAKNLWTDNKLKRLGLYQTNAPHAMDATRHLLYYLTVTFKDNRWIRATKA